MQRDIHVVCRLVVVRIAKFEEAELAKAAKERQRASGGDKRSAAAKSVVGNSPQPIPGRKTRDIIAEKYGIKDPKRLDGEEPDEYVIGENLERRNLTKPQRLLVAVQLDKYHADVAKERERVRKSKGDATIANLQ